MQQSTLILTGGGLGSLVATAVVLSEETRQSIRLLHLKDHRANTTCRGRCAQQQAEHFEATQLLELPLPRMKAGRSASVPAEQYRPPMLHSQLLVVAVAAARELEVDRLIWPVRSNGDFEHCARLTEQIQLARALLALEGGQMEVETPLLELNDQQMIELGGQLQVPWELAWSCLLQGEKPCRVCTACRRRHDAFDAAGMVDPIDELATRGPKGRSSAAAALTGRATATR